MVGSVAAAMPRFEPAEKPTLVGERMTTTRGWCTNGATAASNPVGSEALSTTTTCRACGRSASRHSRSTSPALKFTITTEAAAGSAADD